MAATTMMMMRGKVPRADNSDVDRNRDGGDDEYEARQGGTNHYGEDDDDDARQRESG